MIVQTIDEKTVSTLELAEAIPVKSKDADSVPQSTEGSHTCATLKKAASKEMLPKTSFDPSRTGALWPKRVKVSLASVDLGRMTTVQEACLDSPTIPGRPPLLERSMSVPGVIQHRLSEEANQLTPRAAEFLKGAPENEVPPKSPRTERRASPRANRSQHSAHSSVSTNYSTASSGTSSSSVFGRASPRLMSETRRMESPLGRLSPMSTIDKGSLDSIWNKLFRLESPSRQQKAADMMEKSGPQNIEQVSFPHPVTSPHQRWLSDASVVTRGRIARKESLAYNNHRKPEMRSPSISLKGRDLPTGFKVSEVPRQLADVELRGLKQQADEQVSKFEVLQAKDVNMLSKELRELDDRCEYLQRTYQSLRQGRKSLHERMISYLRSPHMTNFNRESILKQEEALADIDSSIDDWIRKSEKAENRRSRIRQKLLEHVAAALTLRSNANNGPRNLPEQPTPPESPEQDDEFCRSEQHGVQSIKIYADAGVAALLAEIDQEIVSMECSASPTLQSCSDPSSSEVRDQEDPTKKELEAKDREIIDLKVRPPPNPLLFPTSANLPRLHLQDRYLRSVADFRNLQDRTKRDVQSARDFAIQRFAADLIESIDNLDRALETVPSSKLAPQNSDPDVSPESKDYNKDLANLYDGLRMTESILMGTLKKHGMERFDPSEGAGEMFNPNLHEATFQTKLEGKEDGMVFMTQQKGFLLKGRVLRAAKVGVVKNS
ncbi:MAG: hypothetical protein Q9182_000597 [Xanthomendoza sp. 2 TL-2023]